MRVSLALVAPYAGAWIETDALLLNAERLGSHPMRVRGLKLITRAERANRTTSHPMRVRGLKRARDK